MAARIGSRRRLAGASTLAMALVSGLLGAPAGALAQDAAPPDCVAGEVPSEFPGWPQMSDTIVPIPVSAQPAVGPNRFLFTIADTTNQLIAAPDVAVTVDFVDVGTDPNTTVVSGEGTFLASGPVPGRGLYHLAVDFPCAGTWGARFTVRRPGKDPVSAGVLFPVYPESTTPSIGEEAPESDSPTAEDAAGVAAISTDSTPDPDFYRMSIAQAVTSGRPSFIAFATPAFCQTAVCGPTLDMVQEVAAGYKDRVTFVHVEPYVLEQTPNGLQPVLANGGLQVVPAVIEWGLPTEPYLFAVAADGTVSAKFEGMADADELRAALDAITAGG